MHIILNLYLPFVINSNQEQPRVINCSQGIKFNDTETVLEVSISLGVPSFFAMVSILTSHGEKSAVLQIFVLNFNR